MADSVTANLPSADFDRTALFYENLGFAITYRDGGWMIITRGPLVLEFFHGAINPKESWFSACIRVDDLDGLYAAFSNAGISTDPRAIPRIGPPKVERGIIRLFYMTDPDGSLIRCIDQAWLETHSKR